MNLNIKTDNILTRISVQDIVAFTNDSHERKLKDEASVRCRGQICDLLCR
jgi:hypothetical protein